MIKPLLLILSSFFVSSLLAQVALPVNIKGAKIWLKTTANDVQEPAWENQLTKQKIVTTPTENFTTINHNQVPNLDAHQTSLAPLLANTNLAQATIFTVYQAKGKEKILWHLVENGATKVVLTTHRLSDLSNYEYLNFQNIKPNVPTINTYFHHSGNNQKAVKSHLQLAQLPEDQHLPVQAFSGALAEIIVFNRVLDEQERRKVASYLAIKYGLTIQDEYDQTYLSSEGVTIWKTPFGQPKFHRITGIGRDEGSQLNQQKSTSSYDPDFLTIELTSKQLAIPDQAFLLWGDNDGTLTFAKSNRLQARLMNRHWQMQVTEEAHLLPTKLSIDPKSFHLQPKANETFWLVIDTTGNGQFQTEHLQYLPLSAETTNKQLVFDNIVWDSDHSGKDGFTIAIGSKELTEISPEALALLHEQENLTHTSTIPQFDVYPNPSTDGLFQVKIRPNSLKQITLKIHNALGQEITQQSFVGKDYYFYENRLVENGIYFLTITEKEAVYSRKLVVDGW
ncbi:MAG: T9SS type A sorting domain-containing protein [Bacteroidota bacterium]